MLPKIYDPRRHRFLQHQAYVNPLKRWEHYWLVAWVMVITVTVNIIAHMVYRICG